MMHILLAEDDTILADALGAQLRSHGYAVELAPNGPVAQYLLQRQHFDLAILDLGLPMIDGLSVLRDLRAGNEQMPVVVLTAQDGLDARVAGLNAGADDYITKPFDFPELEARLRALLRRSKAATASAELSCANLVFDAKNRRASVQGQALELSPREYTLLELLLIHRDNVVTKDQITQMWASDGGGIGAGNAIEVYIHRLRRRLEGSGLDIRTVRGLGYLLEAPA